MAEYKETVYCKTSLDTLIYNSDWRIQLSSSEYILASETQIFNTQKEECWDRAPDGTPRQSIGMMERLLYSYKSLLVDITDRRMKRL